MALSNDEKQERLMRFLDKKYLEFCQQVGRVANQAAFAKYVGISSASMSQYMSGDRLPDYRNLTRMALSLGMEIYEVLDVKPETDNDPRLLYLMKLWRTMNDKDREALLKFINKLDSQSAS